MEQVLKSNPRIEVVDALRGFAVMAIILVHNVEHFIFPVYPLDSPGWLKVLDQGSCCVGSDICTFVCAERAGDGKRCVHTADRGDCA